MKIELFPFQKIAVAELRFKADQAVRQYAATHTPQVVSLQAPTGSGKTVMMTSFIEDILFGDDRHDEQPSAVFVWLSDSPQLNQQSKDKIDLQSDRISFGQTVMVEDESFDRETFEDGHLYFINTQKLSKAGNLGKKSDGRQWTIWQTIQNTLEQKADRLFFIVDEAHRGMQGNEGGRQTAIMQRFLKGWPDVGLSVLPVVIGMSATPERFNKLVGTLASTIQKVVVPTDDVRASGLLKDRIIITYPEDAEKQDAMAVLAAATREWLDKCEHWDFYCTTQHYKQVRPVFVIQVKAGAQESPVSETDLDAALKKIEDVAQRHFEEGEVVHTFGTATELTVGGLKIPHVDPSAIAGDKQIRVVFFKENLSTGWDCPRAETMMSFRVAEDQTYIAQLLGRMIRTPLQCHVNVDDSLNDVKLYLPYFNAETVDRVIDELRSSECGEIPSYVGGDPLGSVLYRPLGVGARIKRVLSDPNQMTLFADLPQVEKPMTDTQKAATDDEDGEGVSEETERDPHPQQVPIQPPIIVTKNDPVANPDGIEPEAEGEAVKSVAVEQPTLQLEIDRQDIIRRINAMGLVRYEVRTRAQKVHDYLDALLRISSLLTQTRIYPQAKEEVYTEITDMMHAAIAEIRRSGKYAELEKRIREMKLESKTFDAFGESLRIGGQIEFAYITESDIDRQYREADMKLGRAGLPNAYGRRFAEDEDGFKIDSIVFAGDAVCMEKVYSYAKDKFHQLDNDYRMYVASANERVQNEYDEIVAAGEIVSRHNFILPETVPPFAAKDGKVYSDHLYADEDGLARIAFDSGWEQDLIAAEEGRDDFVCWLRNPSRARWALCVPYGEAGEKKGFYPDFIIVRRDYNPANRFGYIVDVLEPHAAAFSDNLAKARGLAEYAREARQLGRIQMIRCDRAMGGGTRLVRLDFSKGEIRDAVLRARTDEDLNALFEKLGVA